MSHSQDLKEAAREGAFARRRIAHSEGLDEAANENLATFICQTSGVRVVSAYMPIRTELNPLPTMTELVERGFRVCVPVIVGKGEPLVFHEWFPGAAMTEGPFRVMVPVETEDLEPDLVIAPLLAFNADGYRLGYGGGFYDRTLRRLQAVGKGIGVGFAYSIQEDEGVPVDNTDVRLHALVTEKGITRFARPVL